MRVVNRTHWHTTDLRAVIARVAREEADAPTRRRLHITIGYRRAREDDPWTSGNAFLGTPDRPGTIRLFVSRHRIDLVGFAHAVAHEVAHARGVTHETMRGSARYTYEAGWRERYAWAEALPIAVAVPKAKAKPDRLARARALHKAALTRLRRAQTIEAKWRRRVRDLERRQDPPSQAA